MFFFFYHRLWQEPRNTGTSGPRVFFGCEPPPKDGLTIENPEGFNSEYLLKASKLMIDLDMQKLMTSWGKTLEVEKAGGFGVFGNDGNKGGSRNGDFAQ